MSCQHLSCYQPAGNSWSVVRCAASKTPYVPSLADLERFCRSGRHCLCPASLRACLGARTGAGNTPLAAEAVS